MKTNSTKTTSVISMIWPPKKWAIPWSPTTITTNHNMEQLNTKNKTNTSHPSKTTPLKNTKSIKLTILMLLTVWFSKKWTALCCQTTKTRMLNGLTRKTRMFNKTSKLKSKGSAISRNTTQSTCPSPKYQPKDNQYNQLISSHNPILSNWIILWKMSKT